MPKISVIVPVYKVEAYLDRCVESILDQSYTDFELILVNDGSPDSCGAMCDAWAEKDSRIKVIHKENGGLSDARNAGFAASCGEWISFVDSDDYIHPQMLEALLRATRDHRVKVAVCGYERTEGEPLSGEKNLTASAWIPEQFYMQRCVNATVAWGKLYHKSVVLPYPKGKLHEDEYVTYRILFGQTQIAVIDAGLYAYFSNETGIMQRPWNVRCLDFLEAARQQIEFFEKMGNKELAYRRAGVYVENLRYQMYRISQLPDAPENDAHMRQCRSHLRQGIRKYKKQGYINPLDHYECYRAAWPSRVGWFALVRTAWLRGSRIKRRILRR